MLGYCLRLLVLVGELFCGLGWLIRLVFGG